MMIALENCELFGRSNRHSNEGGEGTLSNNLRIFDRSWSGKKCAKRGREDLSHGKV